jgi:hypothetical protein
MQKIPFLKYVSFFGACAVLFACASLEGSRKSFILSHPQMPVDIQNAIVNGEVIRGMDQEQVRASLGTPASVARDPAQDGQMVVRWMYLKKLGKYVSVYEVRFVDNKAQEVKSDGYMNPHNSGIYSGAMIAN